MRIFMVIGVQAFRILRNSAAREPIHPFGLLHFRIGRRRRRRSWRIYIARYSNRGPKFGIASLARRDTALVQRYKSSLELQFAQESLERLEGPFENQTALYGG